MRVREIRIIGSVLSRELGWGWPLLLLNCLARKRSLFSDTHWAKDEGPESRFANRLCISAAIYLILVERLRKDRAFEMMREILVPIGCGEQMSNVTSLEVPSDDPMDRLWAFYDFMGQGGVGRFVQRTIVRSDEEVLHYEVRNCFFHRFCTEVGTPELTRLFCEVDTEFFPQAFPEFKFHRGESFDNTVAYGQDHYVFIFERSAVRTRLSTDRLGDRSNAQLGAQDVRRLVAGVER